MRKTLLILTGFLVMGATAAQAADSAACVRRNDVRAWSSPVRKTLIVENYAHKKIRMTLTGNCAGFGVYDSFQITAPNESGASCIAEGDSVITHWAGERGVCVIKTLEPYDGPLHPKGERHTAD